MAVRKNILFNYIGQIYSAVINVAMVPFYIKYMGAEAYGLVGFFAMAQAWFCILDVGLTPTVARETARFRGGATDALSYRHLVRVLEFMFAGIAIVGALTTLPLAQYIANDWLKVVQLPIPEVVEALQLMVLIIGMRWMSSFYRSVISGAEKFVWLSSFNSLIAPFRFVFLLFH